jgi:hypothetical protein
MTTQVAFESEKINYIKLLTRAAVYTIIAYIALVLTASITLIFSFDFPDILRLSNNYYSK